MKMTRAEHRKSKERQNTTPGHPGEQPQGGPNKRKIVAPKELKQLQEALEEEKRQEDKEAQRLIEEATALESQVLDKNSTSMAALALLASHFDLELVPRMIRP